MRLQTQIIKAKTDLIYHIGSTAEFPSDKPDKQRRKKWEVLMKWEDDYFTSVGNSLYCSAHFLLNDVQLSTHIEIGSRTLGLPLDKRCRGVSV